MAASLSVSTYQPTYYLSYNLRCVGVTKANMHQKTWTKKRNFGSSFKMIMIYTMPNIIKIRPKEQCLGTATIFLRQMS